MTVRNFLEDQEIICFLQDSQAAENQTDSGLLFPLSPLSYLHLPCVSFDGLGGLNNIQTFLNIKKWTRR